MPSDIVLVRGYFACPCIAKSILPLEADLVRNGFIKQNFSGLVFQGAWNNSVSASAGTHNGGGVWDVDPNIDKGDQYGFCKIAFAHGWRAQKRFEYQGFSGDHYHINLVGCPHMSKAGADQVKAYKNRRNGLVSNGPEVPSGLPWVTWQEGLRAFQDLEPVTALSVKTITSTNNVQEVINMGLPNLVRQTDGAIVYISERGTIWLQGEVEARAMARVMSVGAWGTNTYEDVLPQEVELVKAILRRLDDAADEDDIAKLKLAIPTISAH